MAMQRRIKVNHADVFPYGAFLVGEVEPVADWDQGKRPDGSRPQARDKETGLPVWQVQVLDADPEARKQDKTVTVKMHAHVQPVPPTNDSGLPFMPVEFTDMTATAWVDDSGKFARQAWSFRASGFAEASPKPGTRSQDTKGAA